MNELNSFLVGMVAGILLFTITLFIFSGFFPDTESLNIKQIKEFKQVVCK